MEQPSVPGVGSDRASGARRRVMLFPAACLRSIRVATKTAVFMLSVLPTLPSRPLDWVIPAPVVRQVRYPAPGGEAEGDLYLPASPGPHPGMVVCLGVVPFGVDHPQVPRLGRALARAGFAALLFWSPAMRDVRLEPEDTDRLAMAYAWLIAQPGIDPDRSGLLGTCVGGAFALLAAAHPSIRDRVSFVVAWAPFASMRALTREIASATVATGDRFAPWTVDQLTRRVFVRSLTSGLPPDEAERLRSACAERDGQADVRAMSREARAIYPLLTALDVAGAEAALEQLPPSVRQRLDGMSPIMVAGEIRAPLIALAHDRDDAVIPIAESRSLRAALSGRPGVRYTEFSMFKHLDPAKVHLSRIALAKELARFYWSVFPIVQAGIGPAQRDGRSGAVGTLPTRH